jgi:hypothetical protein
VAEPEGAAAPVAVVHAGGLAHRAVQEDRDRLPATASPPSSR